MKLLLKGSLQVNQSIILLNNGNCKLLGGRVDNMYEKWQLDKVRVIYIILAIVSNIPSFLVLYVGF